MNFKQTINSTDNNNGQNIKRKNVLKLEYQLDMVVL